MRTAHWTDFHDRSLLVEDPTLEHALTEQFRLNQGFTLERSRSAPDAVHRLIKQDLASLHLDHGTGNFGELLLSDLSYREPLGSSGNVVHESHDDLPFNPQTFRVRDHVDLSMLRRDFQDPRYGVVSNLYKDLNSFETSIVGAEFHLSRAVISSYGRGSTFTQAEGSALLELIERHAMYLPDAELTRCSWEQATADYLDPRPFLHYRRPDPTGRRTGFDPTTRYWWSPVVEAGTGRVRRLPAQLLDLADRQEPRFVIETSNGVALGATRDEARLFGLLELLERDAFLAFWHKRVRLTAIDRASLPDHLRDRIERFTTAERSVHLFDLTFDTQVPVVIALVIAPHSTVRTFLSTAAHLDPVIAVDKALDECLVGHRIYERSDTFGSRHYAGPDDVEDLVDHVAYAARPGSVDGYKFLLSDAPRAALDELHPPQQTNAYRSAGTAGGVIRALRAGPLATKRLYFADLSSPLSRSAGYHVARALSPDLSSMSFGYRHRRIHVDRVNEAVRASRYHDASTLPGEEVFDGVHPYA